MERHVLQDQESKTSLAVLRPRAQVRPSLRLDYRLHPILPIINHKLNFESLMRDIRGLPSD